ncbi:MAG TPA: hypothetical protein VFZ31_16830 [Vicinamibacterales bacterium]
MFVLAAGAAASCSTPAQPTRSAAPLAHTFESPEALARAVLDGLGKRDATALRSLALSESEFRDHVWPELPASRPERNVPFEYAWGQMKQRSEGSLGETLARYGGKPLRFVRTRFTGDTTAYQSFTVMRESEIIAADETGRELILQLYGSAMLKDSRYKLYSFVVD